MNTPVNFELAKLLKEKGFDNESSHYFNEEGEVLFDRDFPSLQPTKPKEYYDAPTIAEIVMWLYDKHGIWIQPTICSDKSFRVGCIEINNKPLVEHIVRNKNEQLYFNSPTETYEAAIEYTLNNLV